MKTVIGFVILAVVVGGVYVLNDITRSDDGRSILDVAGQTPIRVATANPERGDIVRTVQAPGDVEAFAEVDISSEVVGKILEMPVEEGDEVEEGDLLCRLDDADFRARVLSAEANVALISLSGSPAAWAARVNSSCTWSAVRMFSVTKRARLNAARFNVSLRVPLAANATRSHSSRNAFSTYRSRRCTSWSPASAVLFCLLTVAGCR